MKLLQELSAPTRIRINEGDIFAYKIGEDFRFIRVISIKFNYLGPGKALLYFYRACSSQMKEIPSLQKEELLIPPVIIFKEALRDGLTLRVDQQPLAPGDRYERHCFDHGSKTRESFVDDNGEKVSYFEPCGRYRLSFALDTVEVQLATALGYIPVDLDEPDQYERMNPLPDQPRPLLRESKKDKLPGRYCLVCLPDYPDKVIPFVMSWPGPKGKPRQFEEPYCKSVAILLFREVPKVADFRKVADTAHLGHDWWGEICEMGFLIKCRQHQLFYQMIAESMQRLGLDRYWIAEGEFGDWLAGTVSAEEVAELGWQRSP